MSIVIPNPACAEQCTTTTDTTSSIIWLEVVVPGAWKGISWAGGSESIIAVQGDAGIGTGSPWISIDSGTSWANQAGAFGDHCLSLVSLAVTPRLARVVQTQQLS